MLSELGAGHRYTDIWTEKASLIKTVMKHSKVVNECIGKCDSFLRK